MKAPLFTVGACWIAALAGLALAMHGAQPQAGTANGSAETTRGQALFGERCAICHYDQSAAQKMGPGLKGIYARGQFADGRKVDDAGMARWIENGGKDMPPMKDELKPDEIRALVSYLRTL
jgi:mono/diheme cytochrome c family protein